MFYGYSSSFFKGGMDAAKRTGGYTSIILLGGMVALSMGVGCGKTKSGVSSPKFTSKAFKVCTWGFLAWRVQLTWSRNVCTGAIAAGGQTVHGMPHARKSHAKMIPTVSEGKSTTFLCVYVRVPHVSHLRCAPCQSLLLYNMLAKTFAMCKRVQSKTHILRLKTGSVLKGF